MLGHDFLMTFCRCRSIFYGSKFYDSCIELYESDYNCGYKNNRMTERGIEITLAKKWLSKNKSNINDIIEAGAVTPYYLPNKILNILDAYDSHELVNYKMDMLDYDFTNKYIISISTIEHVGTGDYDLEKREISVYALNKLLSECKCCLITFPMGYNKSLDKYVVDGNVRNANVKFYKRGKFDNAWKSVNVDKVRKPHYSHMLGANEIAVIEK